MANLSKRFLYGIRALRPRGADPSPRTSISDPHLRPGPPPVGGRTFSSSVPPTGLSDPGRPSPGTSPYPCSPSGIWRRACSHRAFSPPASPDGLSSRAFSPRFEFCSPPVRNWKGSGCSGPGIAPLGIVRAGGSWLRAGFSSSASSNARKAQASLVGRSLAAKPLTALTSTVSRYREAVGLQIEAFWKRNYLVLVGAAGVALCIALWRIMFGVASTFVGLSEGMAKYGFLALASAIVAFAGLYIRSRFTINPDRIYRIAMRKLNTSAGILEIMGAPLTGTDVRAYVMSGGGPRLKNFKLRFGGKRCFLIFPIRGSERRGLVSVEAKKKKGQYDIKLLAVDVPMATGPDQRVFLIGDEGEYKVGGGLISELRDPIVKAMAAEKEFEDLDLEEEEEDEKRELAEQERKRLEEMVNVEKEGS
uniref:Molybdenum cofactor biosynthesis protein 1 n=1 Tax=Anthurium amnicola TaxID=1678845 RepID=A0A1D1XWR4_9ARAE